MTVINIESAKPARRFLMEGGGWVELRTVTIDELKAIRKATVSKRVEYKRIDGKAERFEVEEVNADLQNEMFWDRIITDWGDLFDAKDAPIPCTKENKILLMTRSAKFAVFVAESIAALTEEEKAAEGLAEKN